MVCAGRGGGRILRIIHSSVWRHARHTHPGSAVRCRHLLPSSAHAWKRTEQWPPPSRAWLRVFGPGWVLAPVWGEHAQYSSVVQHGRTHVYHELLYLIGPVLGGMVIPPCNVGEGRCTGRRATSLQPGCDLPTTRVERVSHLRVTAQSRSSLQPPRPEDHGRRSTLGGVVDWHCGIEEYRAYNTGGPASCCCVRYSAAVPNHSNLIKTSILAHLGNPLRCV